MIFLDDYHVDKAPQIMLPLRRALEAFVKQLGPFDLVAVMEPLTPLTHVKFTRNREELLEQMHSFEGRRGEIFPVKSAAEEAQLTVRNLAEVRGGVTLDALNAIVTHLGGLREGRKSVLFVSQGPPTGLSNSSPNFSRLQDVLRNANRGNVTINALDPRPLGSVGFGGDFVLRMLADTTGGRAIVNTNNPDTALKQVIADASAYYLVGYAPSRAETNDGKFHKITVKVKRRGTHVTARQGYWAPSAEEMAPRFKEPPPSEVTNALSDLIRPISGRDFDLWVGAVRGGSAKTRLLVTWDPTNRFGNSHPAQLDVEILSDDGKPVGDVQTIATAQPGGQPSVGTLEAAPGALTLRFTVKAADGTVVDQWREKIHVPSLAGELALATPRFYRARSPFELRALEADPSPTPAASRQLRTTERVFVEIEVVQRGTGTRRGHGGAPQPGRQGAGHATRACRGQRQEPHHAAALQPGAQHICAQDPCKSGQPRGQAVGAVPSGAVKGLVGLVRRGRVGLVGRVGRVGIEGILSVQNLRNPDDNLPDHQTYQTHLTYQPHPPYPTHPTHQTHQAHQAHQTNRDNFHRSCVAFSRRILRSVA